MYLRRSWLLCTVLMCACIPDLEIVPETHISCAVTADCPGTMQCRESIGLCVPEDTETQPPDVLASTVSIEPPVARRNSEVVLRFEVSEILSGPPTVSLEVAEAVQLRFVAVDGLVYEYRVTIDGDEGEGNWDLSAALSDRAGNRSTAFLGSLALDFTPPALAGQLAATPAVIGGSQSSVNTAEIGFTVSEDLQSAPIVSAVWADGDSSTDVSSMLSMSTEQGRDYLFVYAAAEADPSGPTGLRIDMTDVAGNTTRVEQPAAFHVDRTPPGIVPGSGFSLLLPQVENPLRFVTTAGVGTTIQVGFTTDEPLAAEPTLATSVNGLVGALSLSAGNSYVFLIVVPPLALAETPAESFEVTLLDLYGNQSVLLVAGGSAGSPLTALLDVTAPEAPNEAAIVYHRVPWGSSVTDGEPRFWVTAEPAAAEADSLLIVYDDSEVATAARIGEQWTDGAGGLAASAPVELNPSDRDVVYVVAVDGAGNSSDNDPRAPGVQATPVTRISWTATLGNKQAGDTFRNPHRLQGRTVFSAALNQADERELGAEDGVSEEDGVRARTSGASTWRHLSEEADALGASQRFAIAYSTVDDEALIFGNEARLCFPAPARFLRFGGAAPWSGVSIPDGVLPDGRGGAAMTYDVRRDRAVLFGGSGSDTWEWSGTHWLQRCPGPMCDVFPSPRTDHAMAYDDLRGVTVLFGGSSGADETWEWDGVRWTERCDAAPCTGARPSGRKYHAMTFDRNLGEVLLYGGDVGSGETWSWNGKRWLQRCDSSPCNQTTPGARARVAMAFDSTRDEVVLFGGADPSIAACPSGVYPVSTWTWDGFKWVMQAPTTAPEGRTGGEMVYHAGRESILLVGGAKVFCGGVSCGKQFGTDETWEWDGAEWTLISPLTSPPASRGHAMEYDPARGNIFACGGQLGSDGWNWTGDGWEATSASSLRQNATLSRYGTGKSARLLFTGGLQGTTVYSATYRLNAAGWSARTNMPAVRHAHASAYDGSGIVVFGGTTDVDSFFGSAVATTYRWDGTAWSTLCTGACSRPPASTLHAMASTGSTNEVLLFGGLEHPSVTLSDSTYRWTGSRWVTDVSSEIPMQRYDHQMAYDSGRGQVLMTGGSDLLGVAVGEFPDPQLAKIWQWGAGEWTLLPLSDREGDGYPQVVVGGSMAYDPSRDQMVLFGGTSFSADGDDSNTGTWVGAGGATTRAGHKFTAVWGAAGVVGDETIEAVSARWVGAGQGALAGGASRSGQRIRIWDSAGWRDLQGAASNGEAVWSTRDDAQFAAATPADLRRLFRGSALELHLALLPSAANGASSSFGWVDTDYVEVRVEYRRAP